MEFPENFHPGIFKVRAATGQPGGLKVYKVGEENGQ